ncbi:MAG TPA: glutamate--tRNA ligase [Steroidobacteraceae bacterium]|nr:glutamate--tRNA ligase [Steroidobacteraceae bacterium]
MTRLAVTRFAPSPTGSLHLGNARTALFNFLLARQLHGQFLLRIEDTDLERSAERYLGELIDDLHWLGLNWDAGPDVGGPRAPYRQSQRNVVYAEYFARLEAGGKVYPCFCTPLELEVSRRAQLAAGQPPRYAGTCRELSALERAERTARGLQPSLRFRIPQGQLVEFTDFVRGAQCFASEDIGDFIVRRADGTAAFFFCNALDDALMEVTHVLRGDDHLTNTPRQILLLEALGLGIPQYGHVALLTGMDGAPLSKRHGSVSAREFRERGFLPQAIVNHLFRLGHTSDQEGWLDLEDMPAHFRLDHLGRAPARFDETQLIHWQKEAIARAPTDALIAWLKPRLPAGVDATRMRGFVELVRHNIVLPEDAAPWIDIVFGDLPALSDSDRRVVDEAGSGFFREAANAFERHGPDLKALGATLKAATGRKGPELFMPLRLALTGRLHGPELAPLLKLLPPDTARRRLEAWAKPH